ncbi:hypothetical protein [Microbacterium sp. 10M-3C3]|uniref:hypothetical protein n=1 Tax=Microbacterium sp. 10M-3C3 TaxID=2483401 RepID=UPI000F644EF4|nr:hypothetical protein [Microbacterium sp. 10M-3C3]
MAAIVLSVAAVERVRSTAASDASPIPTFSFGPGTASPSPTPSPTATPSGPAWPAADERFLTAGSGVLWRATAGQCGGPAPVVERSTDAGATWTDVTPTYRGIAQVISLDAFAGIQAEMVAATGPNCEVQALRTFTEGEFWAPYPDVLAASSYQDPKARSVIITPSGTLEAPCADPRSVRAAGDKVALVCSGKAWLTQAGRWQELGATDVLAVALTEGDPLVAARADGCRGMNSSAGTSVVTCVPDVDPFAPTALTTSGADVLTWSGDTFRSSGP